MYILYMIHVGIYGFGRFGRFLAKGLHKKHFKIFATSRTDYSQSNEFNKDHVTFIHNLKIFFQQKIDILIIATSIISFSETLQLLKPYLLRKSNSILIVDVCSVKEFPKSKMLQYFANIDSIDLLCTHPMFGPDSALHSYQDLPFMFEKVRIQNHDRCNIFLQNYQNLGCHMVELSCLQHDIYTSNSQFITHLTGRILSQLHLQSTPINTKGYEMLLGLVNNTENDSLELFKGLYKYNNNSKKCLLDFKKSLDSIISDLED